MLRRLSGIKARARCRHDNATVQLGRCCGREASLQSATTPSKQVLSTALSPSTQETGTQQPEQITLAILSPLSACW